MAAQSDARNELKADQKNLDLATKTAWDTQTITLPPDGQTFNNDKNPLGISDDKWLLWTADKDKDDVRHPTDTDQSSRDQFNAYWTLERVGQTGLLIPRAATSAPKDGIPVRFPVPGQLAFCSNAPCHDPGQKAVKVFDPQPVLQLGTIVAVPANGGWFQDVTMSFSTDENGAPTTLEVKENSAAAATATGALSNVATTAAQVPVAISAAKLAKVTAETNLVNQQNALINAQAQGTDQSTLDTAQAQTALAQAKLNLLNAQTSLEAAQKAQNVSGD